MLYDRDGKLLWIADENGGFEIVQPGGGFNGRTREPGEPDWWVVAKDPAWAPDTMKQADPKAQTPPAEPWTLFSAGQEHLDHLDHFDTANGFGEAVGTMTEGIGEAVSKGAEGAGEALGKTWDVLTTNEELKKGVEFGGKAAWEVTKDVAERAGKDAAGALGGYWSKDIGKDPKPTGSLGSAGGLIIKGVKLYNEAPDWGRDLGERLYKIKDNIYLRK
jgi:hypothetical protein